MSEEVKEQLTEDEEEGGLSLFDYLIILAKRKKLILTITLSVAVIAFILTLFKTTFYQAEISIFPSHKQEISMATQMMSQIGIFSDRGGGDLYNNQRLFVELIKSRTVTDRLMNRFNIKKAKGTEDTEDARRDFLKRIKITPDFTDKKGFKLNESPLMKISVKDQNPQRAADIANAIVEELNIFVNDIAISKVSQRRLFFEKQLKQASDALIASEGDIMMFQERTGVLKVEDQTSMVIEKIANLQAQITAQEIQLQVMQSYSTASNPDVQRIEETVKALKKELTKLENKNSGSKDLLIPTGSIPSVGLKYKRLFRELKFNEALYEIIIKQYEAAKLDEAKDATLIQVIDKAVPPKKKGSVRKLGRAKAATITVLAFLLSCLIAFAMEYKERASGNKEFNVRIKTLWRYLSFK